MESASMAMLTNETEKRKKEASLLLRDQYDVIGIHLILCTGMEYMSRALGENLTIYDIINLSSTCKLLRKYIYEYGHAIKYHKEKIIKEMKTKKERYFTTKVTKKNKRISTTYFKKGDLDKYSNEYSKNKRISAFSNGWSSHMFDTDSDDYDCKADDFLQYNSELIKSDMLAPFKVKKLDKKGNPKSRRIKVYFSREKNVDTVGEQISSIPFIKVAKNGEEERRYDFLLDPKRTPSNWNDGQRKFYRFMCISILCEFPPILSKLFRDIRTTVMKRNVDFTPGRYPRFFGRYSGCYVKKVDETNYQVGKMIATSDKKNYNKYCGLILRLKETTTDIPSNSKINLRNIIAYMDGTRLLQEEVRKPMVAEMYKQLSVSDKSEEVPNTDRDQDSDSESELLKVERDRYMTDSDDEIVPIPSIKEDVDSSDDSSDDSEPPTKNTKENSPPDTDEPKSDLSSDDEVKKADIRKDAEKSALAISGGTKPSSFTPEKIVERVEELHISIKINPAKSSNNTLKYKGLEVKVPKIVIKARIPFDEYSILRPSYYINEFSAPIKFLSIYTLDPEDKKKYATKKRGEGIYNYTRGLLGVIRSDGVLLPTKLMELSQGGIVPKFLSILNDSFAEEEWELGSKLGELCGYCMMCGKTLKEEKSLNRGYGDTCKKRYGLSRDALKNYVVVGDPVVKIAPNTSTKIEDEIDEDTPLLQIFTEKENKKRKLIEDVYHMEYAPIFGKKQKTA